MSKDGNNSPHPLGEGIGKRVRSIKIDKEALAGAVGLMCLSWAALPIVYWLIVRKKKDEKTVKKETRSDDRHQQAEEISKQREEDL